MVEVSLILKKLSLLPVVSDWEGRFFMYDITETGNRIRELRKKKRKTQEQVAADVGIKVKTYQAIEQGKRGASIDTLFLLSEYFGVSMDFLVKGVDRVSALDIQLSAMSRDNQEKVVRIMKNIILTLGW